MEAEAPTLAVSCPFCLAMMEDGLKAQPGFEAAPVKVRHVVELVADAIGEPAAAVAAAAGPGGTSDGGQEPAQA